MGGVLGGRSASGAPETVAIHAGQLAGQHALRGADAVHLASALAVSATSSCLPLGTSGSMGAAQKPGLTQ